MPGLSPTGRWVSTSDVSISPRALAYHVAENTYPVNKFLNILKAGINHPLFVMSCHVDLLPVHLTCLVQLGHPFLRPERSLITIVVAEDPCIVLLHFNPSAWLQTTHDTAVKSCPVRGRSAKGAAVNVVEVLLLAVCPLVLVVIDMEFAVRRNPFRLNGREIDTVYVSRWKFICHLYGPNSRPCTEVKDPHTRGRRILWCGEWRGVKLASKEETPDVVLQVETFLLLVVIGKHVLPLAVGVVPPPVLVLVVEDGGCYGGRVSAASIGAVGRVMIFAGVCNLGL